MWIMIAGPYRSGASSEADRKQNLANLNRAAYELFRKGHVPVVGVNCALPLIAAAGSDAYESIMMPLSWRWPIAVMLSCGLVASAPVPMRRSRGYAAGAASRTTRSRRFPMPIEPSNPRLQRTALRAAAEPPSRYRFRSIHTGAAPYQRSLATLYIIA